MVVLYGDEKNCLKEEVALRLDCFAYARNDETVNTILSVIAREQCDRGNPDYTTLFKRHLWIASRSAENDLLR